MKFHGLLKQFPKEVKLLITAFVITLNIFFLLGGLLSLTSINRIMKSVLMFEPFVSIVLTFGGIYILRIGVLWFKYIIMLSGIAMVLSIVFSSFFILKESIYTKN